MSTNENQIGKGWEVTFVYKAYPSYRGDHYVRSFSTEAEALETIQKHAFMKGAEVRPYGVQIRVVDKQDRNKILHFTKVTGRFSIWLPKK